VNERLTPLPYQEHDIQEVIKNDGNALIVSSVGGRKTLVAVEVGVRMRPGTILVIAPRNTLVSWKETIERQDDKAVVQRLASDKKGKAALAGLIFEEEGWYLCTPQWFARQSWTTVVPDLAIFDEIHTAANYQNTSRAALHQLQAKRRIGMSGTPLRNKFENAWALVRWIWPDLMPKNYWLWRKQDCAGKYDRFMVQNWRVTGEKIPGQLVNSLPCYIQHLQREKCCEFHPDGFLDLEEPRVVIRHIELSAKQRRFYKQMEDNYVAWLTTPGEDGRLPVVAQLPIVARGMLRTCSLGLPSINLETEKLYFEDNCESPKIDADNGLLATLEQLDGSPVIVYTHDKRFTKVMVKRLIRAGYRAVEWSGDVKSDKQRSIIKQAFIDGEIDVLVAVIGAIGTGTDGIQYASSTEIWISESDDGTDNEQGRGRLDRPGQRTQVLRIYLRGTDTMDEGVTSKQIDEALALNRALRKRKR
jgi:hypothetical protein